MVSGEAENPGPTQTQTRSRTKTKPAGSYHGLPLRHEADLALTFHNAQGLGDYHFRKYYLSQARKRQGILGIAETKCGSPKDEALWAQDYPQRQEVFWASADRAAAGVALFIPNDVNAKELHVEYRDPMARILAVSGTFRGIRMVIIVLHAETLTEFRTGSVDADQAKVYARAQAHIPKKPGYTYAWLMDTNNTPGHLDKTMKQPQARPHDPTHHHPLSTRAMQEMMRHFDTDTRDAYRELHPTSRSHTRVNKSGSKGVTSCSRIDRIYLSHNIWTGQLPMIKEATHIYPGSADMATLRAMGSTSAYSDHAAVRITIQTTDTPKAPIRPSIPLHVMTDDQLIRDMWAIRDKAIAQAKPGHSMEAIEDIIQNSQDRVTETLRERTTSHRKIKSELHKSISKCEAFLGLGHTGRADHLHLRDGPQKDRVMLEKRKELVKSQDSLLSLHMAEQERWCKDRDFTDAFPGETCTRAFFDEVRGDRVDSHIAKLRTPDGSHTYSNIHTILKGATSHHAEKGGVFNRTLPTDPQSSHERAQARAQLLDALEADNKRIPTSHSNDLSLEQVITPEHVQQALWLPQWEHIHRGWHPSRMVQTDGPPRS